MITNTTLERLNSINLHDLPVGKYIFTATVQEIKDIHEVDCYGSDIYVPYVYFKNIQILINGIWFFIECSGTPVKFKINKKFNKQHIENNDIVHFCANVIEKTIEFAGIEGQDIDNELYDLELEDYYEPFATLPKDYEGIVEVDVYETAFTASRRLWKNNYTECFDRQTFNKKIKTINCKRKATNKNSGYFREVQGMYFNGKEIKNLSKIRKFRKEKEGKTALKHAVTTPPSFVNNSKNIRKGF